MTDSEIADKYLTDYKDKVCCSACSSVSLVTHIPSLGREPVGEETTEVCDAWPCSAKPCLQLPSQPQGITAP